MRLPSSDILLRLLTVMAAASGSIYCAFVKASLFPVQGARQLSSSCWSKSLFRCLFTRRKGTGGFELEKRWTTSGSFEFTAVGSYSWMWDDWDWFDICEQMIWELQTVRIVLWAMCRRNYEFRSRGWENRRIFFFNFALTLSGDRKIAK